MTKNIRLYASASVLAAAAFAATPAWAEGTAAGTLINNSVSLTYKVGALSTLFIRFAVGTNQEAYVSATGVSGGSLPRNVLLAIVRTK